MKNFKILIFNYQPKEFKMSTLSIQNAPAMQALDSILSRINIISGVVVGIKTILDGYKTSEHIITLSQKIDQIDKAIIDGFGDGEGSTPNAGGTSGAILLASNGLGLPASFDPNSGGISQASYGIVDGLMGFGGGTGESGSATFARAA